ncbi:DNA-3-methyladenine glycosylase I [Apilactobacillus micheneri]|uniref:DNA-3-methyladenine glycosylase I n=1 Tax=Apilactobacillus micheneri TaxID=1899430 RepID=UPI00112687A1|nr:DNA-3-methyladenine glycosylase I [Apilactobacillus micheneri]TPR43929.1 DNA-3-methyladenine glycosylase I [Apilactobacillus micheneri]TPR47701.1 DNA-3-methyladenine glycosylase I [Apilactobacillus micheneri]
MIIINRCAWVNDNQLMQQYHDHEWGRPCHDDQKLFELLSLEMMQAGLSWQTVLNKRANFRKAFYNFDINKVSKMDNQIDLLMQDAGIIRNRLKINAIINNAKVIQNLDTSFNDYVLQFVDNKPINHHFNNHKQIPSTDNVAKNMSNQMKKDGFKFAGPIVIYSFMQAAGLVNDHEANCFLS